MSKRSKGGLSLRSISHRHAPATSRAAFAAAAFLAAAIALGGGGSPAPLPELILELLAAAFAASFQLIPKIGFDWSLVPRRAWIIAAIAAGVPLLQLVPLPPVLWHALPGRESQVQALSLIGAENTWRAWSLAPGRTLASLLALGPPLFLLLVTSALPRADRSTLIFAIPVMTVASLILGALQLSTSGGSQFHLYGSVEPVLFGFQANHNSTADVLLIGMMAVPLLLIELVDRRIVRDRPIPVMTIAAAGIAIVGLGIVLTASRMGIFLTPVALACCLWLLRRWFAPNLRRLAIGAAVAVVVTFAAILALRDNPAIASVLARFEFSGELRPQLWQDSLYIAGKYMPMGVGMGDFAPAFVADERLESISFALPNRAHNDFIELACEAGLVGLAGLAVIVALLGRNLIGDLRSRSRVVSNQAAFAAGVFVVMALHSLVDYPFRSMALACLGAVSAGILLPPRSGDVGDSAGSDANQR